MVNTIVRRGAFSTGFIFEYETIEEMADHLLVVPKFANLKEEILQSGFVGKRKWRNLVYLKAVKFWNTAKVKRLRSENPWPEPTLEHLLAIILYCDFTTFCTAFSSTYRRENVFETMESVISRHSEYANCGRLLVELKWICGISHGEGPFYCGMDRVFNIGSFAISLKGPCSTSIVREVAVNFAQEKGMILTVNNDNYDGKEATYIDCSWISNFAEESKRLWIGVRRSIRIESIVLVRSAKNYQNAVRALYLFDSMISDLTRPTMHSTQADYEVISNLMAWKLNGGPSEMDEYLKNEWTLFLQHRKTLILNLYHLDWHYKALSKLVMFNVLRPEFIDVFSSLENIYIDICGNSYNIRLEALLESLQSIGQPRVPAVKQSSGMLKKIAAIPSKFRRNSKSASTNADKSANGTRTRPQRQVRRLNIRIGAWWRKDGLSDEISALFDSAGWSIKWVQDEEPEECQRWTQYLEIKPKHTSRF